MNFTPFMIAYLQSALFENFLSSKRGKSLSRDVVIKVYIFSFSHTPKFPSFKKNPLNQLTVFFLKHDLNLILKRRVFFFFDCHVGGGQQHGKCAFAKKNLGVRKRSRIYFFLFFILFFFPL